MTLDQESEASLIEYQQTVKQLVQDVGKLMVTNLGQIPVAKLYYDQEAYATLLKQLFELVITLKKLDRKSDSLPSWEFFKQVFQSLDTYAPYGSGTLKKSGYLE
jgi:hypothetical protein